MYRASEDLPSRTAKYKLQECLINLDYAVLEKKVEYELCQAIRKKSIAEPKMKWMSSEIRQ